jgi:porin
MIIAEVQYTYPAIGSMEEPGEGAPLGHTYRLGAWYNSGRFADQRIDNTGLSLASSSSSGVPLQHRGDYSIYAVADQMVWRNANDPNQSVSVFGRLMGTPQSDRNLVDFSFNGGVVLHDPIVNRADDTLGFGVGYAHVSGRAAALDLDTALVAQSSGIAGYYPIRSSEAFVELTYQYQVHPWWQLQPDIQYVFNPGGGIVNPNNVSQRVRNELVLGLRTNVLF